MRRSALLAGSGSKHLSQHPSAAGFPQTAAHASAPPSSGTPRGAGASAGIGTVSDTKEGGPGRVGGNAPTGVVEFRCLFSTQLIKKRKTWQDGLLRVYPSIGKCSVLRAPSDVDASHATEGSSTRPRGAGQRLVLSGVVDGRQLSTQEMRGVLGGDIDEIEFETCIVTIERTTAIEELANKTTSRIHPAESVVPKVHKFKPPDVIAPPRQQHVDSITSGASAPFREPWDGKMQQAKPRSESGSSIPGSGPALYRVDEGELDDIWASTDHGRDKNEESLPPTHRPFVQVHLDTSVNGSSVRQLEISRSDLRIHDDHRRSGAPGPPELLVDRGYFGVAEPPPSPPVPPQPQSKRARLGEEEDIDISVTEELSSSIPFGHLHPYCQADDDDVPLGFISDPPVQTSLLEKSSDVSRFHSIRSSSTAPEVHLGGMRHIAVEPPPAPLEAAEAAELQDLLVAEAEWW